MPARTPIPDGRTLPPSGTIILPRRIFKTHYFHRWMRKTALTDADLCTAVAEMAAGLIDADLGGGVVKKRVGVSGRGKRGSTRMLIATNRGGRWFFMAGFAKNQQDNIDEDELRALKEYAGYLLKCTDAQLDEAVADGELREITDDCKNQTQEPNHGSGA